MPKKREIKFIEKKQKRKVTFTKRKNGIIKKVQELQILTGCEIMIVIGSDVKKVYTYASSKFNEFIKSDEGKNIIKNCLNKK